MQKENAKTPKQPGFFQRKIMAYKAKRLLKWSKELNLTLVQIVRRGGASYIVAPDGQYLRIGAGRK